MSRFAGAPPSVLAALWAAGAVVWVFAYIKYEAAWLVGAFLVWIVLPVAWLLDPKDGGDGAA